MTFGMIEDPVSLGERAAVARRCVAGMKVPIPAIVDKMDDAVNLAYGAWPERLYVIGIDGKIAYAGRPGPFGFEPSEMEGALQKLFPKTTGVKGAAARESGR